MVTTTVTLWLRPRKDMVLLSLVLLSTAKLKICDAYYYGTSVGGDVSDGPVLTMLSLSRPLLYRPLRGLFHSEYNRTI